MARSEAVLLACPIMDGPYHMVEVLPDDRPDGAIGERKPYWCPYHKRRFWERELLRLSFEKSKETPQ
jgi:hypothetical protein